MTQEVEIRANGAVQVQEPADDRSSMMAFIERAARDEKFDVEKFRELLNMRERFEAREAEMAFNRAMKAAQEEMRPVIRDAENQHTRSRYARLETIDANIRPIYTKHGFSLTFNSPTSDANGATVSCTVLHDAGHSKPYLLAGALDSAGSQGKSNKTPIQALGSTVSYLRRYLTCMIFNIVLKNEDNDGNGTPKKISEEQIRQLLTMMSACEMDERSRAKFLDIANVKHVEDITDAQFPMMMKLLNEKHAQRSQRR